MTGQKVMPRISNADEAVPRRWQGQGVTVSNSMVARCLFRHVEEGAEEIREAWKFVKTREGCPALAPSKRSVELHLPSRGERRGGKYQAMFMQTCRD